MHDRSPPQGGFTLLEILVALAVLGFVLVMLSQGVQFGLQAWRSQARIAAERGDLDTVGRTLRNLVGRMDPGGQAAGARVVGDDRTLAFTTDLPLAAVQPANRHADVSLSVDSAHRLSLFWVTHFRNWLGPARVPAQATLADGVDHLDVSYWQSPVGGKPGAWLARWDGRVALPGLVKFRIVFTDRRRHWPDIVTAPMRERPHP
jgi:prepilin-type N-terminal cleavage/methylation domain-containing protein